MHVFNVWSTTCSHMILLHMNNPLCWLTQEWTEHDSSEWSWNTFVLCTFPDRAASVNSHLWPLTWTPDADLFAVCPDQSLCGLLLAFRQHSSVLCVCVCVLHHYWTPAVCSCMSPAMAHRDAVKFLNPWEGNWGNRLVQMCHVSNPQDIIIITVLPQKWSSKAESRSCCVSLSIILLHTVSWAGCRLESLWLLFKLTETMSFFLKWLSTLQKLNDSRLDLEVRDSWLL